MAVHRDQVGVRQAVVVNGFELEFVDLLLNLHRVVLRQRRAGAGRLAPGQARQGGVLGKLQRHDANVQGVGAGAEPGRRPQGLPALPLGGGDGFQMVQGDLQPHRRTAAAPLELQQVLGHVPAIVLRAHPVGLRDPHVVEEHLIDLVIGGQGDDRLDFDPRRRHGNEQEGDALLRPAGAVGAHQAKDVVGELGMGGPDLGAVDDVVVAILHRRGLQAGEVRAGTRFGIALAPVMLAGEHLRQVVRLLLGRAVFEQHRGKHAQPQGNQAGRARLGELLAKDVLLGGGPTGAAVLDRPGWHGPALLHENGLPRHGQFLVREHRGRSRCGPAHVVAEPNVEKAPHFVPEGLILGAVGDIHCVFVPCALIVNGT